MSLELYIQDQRKEAKAEGQYEAIKTLLNIKGFMNDNIEQKLQQAISDGRLNEILEMIAEVQSLEDFENFLSGK